MRWDIVKRNTSLLSDDASYILVYQTTTYDFEVDVYREKQKYIKT